MTVVTFRNEGNETVDETLKTQIISPRVYLDIPARTGNWNVVGVGAPRLTNPNNTSENTLLTLVIPGGLMGPNGVLKFESLWATTGSTNAKTCRIRVNGTAVQSLNINAGSTLANWMMMDLHNLGSETAQIGPPLGATTYSNLLGVAPATYSFDTGKDLTVTFNAQAAVGSETIRLEFYKISIISAS